MPGEHTGTRAFRMRRSDSGSEDDVRIVVLEATAVTLETAVRPEAEGLALLPSDNIRMCLAEAPGHNSPGMRKEKRPRADGASSGCFLREGYVPGEQALGGVACGEAAESGGAAGGVAGTNTAAGEEALQQAQVRWSGHQAAVAAAGHAAKAVGQVTAQAAAVAGQATAQAVAVAGQATAQAVAVAERAAKAAKDRTALAAVERSAVEAAVRAAAAVSSAAVAAGCLEAVQQAQAEGLTLRLAANGTSYVGVSHQPREVKPYQAKVYRGGKTMSLGYFATAEAAALCIARSPQGRATAAERAAAAPPPMTSEQAQQQAKAEGLTLRVADTKSGFFSVSLAKPGKSKPYQVQMKRGGKQVHLGNFATAEEAALCVARSPEGKAAALRAAAAER